MVIVHSYVSFPKGINGDISRGGFQGTFQEHTMEYIHLDIVHVQRSDVWVYGGPQNDQNETGTSLFLLSRNVFLQDQTIFLRHQPVGCHFTSFMGQAAP